MKINLFLQGDIGVGKSKLIKESLLPYLPKVGGFFVQRIFIGDRYAAFKLNPLHEAEEYELNKNVTSLDLVDNLFLYSDAQGRWYRNPDVFENSGITCLKKSLVEKKDLILLDELGGIELNCPAFMKEVLNVLNGDIPVLGVLKSTQNAEKMAVNLADKTKISEHKNFFDYIKLDPRMELLNLNKKNYEEITTIVKDYVEAVLK
ncbi:MAG: nucleoside-triphosphatase [Bacillota bacterium]|nr:nucleoside-triphosphatase [Bacillota bacterium]